MVSTHLEPGQRSGNMVFPVGRGRGFARLPAGRSGQDGAGNEGEDGAGKLYDKARCGGRIKMVELEEKVVGFCEKVEDFRPKVLHFLHLPPHAPPFGGQQSDRR